MTFSLVGRCARTGQFGTVVTSSSPSVASRCAWARAGVGAAATQNITDPTLGNALLDALEEGLSAQEAMDKVVAAAPFIEYRQLSVIDNEGRTATFTGANTLGLNRVAEGTAAAAAGNLLSDAGVPQAMVAAFEADPDAELAGRLIAALAAGEAAGGEEGPVHSCGVLVVDKVAWPVTDLRFDWSETPVADIQAAWEVWQPQAADYVTRALNPQSAPSYGVPGDE